MWKQIIIGLLVSGMGGLLVCFAQQLVSVFGVVDRAERNLSSTKSMYVLIGFFVVIFGMLMVFGVIPVDSQINNITSI